MLSPTSGIYRQLTSKGSRLGDMRFRHKHTALSGGVWNRSSTDGYRRPANTLVRKKRPDWV